MKLCLDARPATPHFPGIGRYIKGLAQALPAELGPIDQPRLLINPQQSVSWVDDLLKGPQWSSSVVSASPFSLAQHWQVPRLLRHVGSDLYHSAYYLMPYRPGIPTVLTVYDLIPLLFPQFVSAKARLLFRLTMTLALKSAARVIAISAATQRDFRSYFHLPEEMITAIPLAAGEIFRPPTPEAILQVRSNYALPEKYVLYVGINKPHKNLPRLVQAWARLAEDHQLEETTLVIAGVWDSRYPQAKQLVNNLNLEGSISFLGPIPDQDLPGLYAGARLFVYPSLHEGFGLPVLEAQSCGAAVVCSRSSSLPEVAGEAAIYFNPTDVDDMAENLSKPLDDEGLLESLRARGLEQAQKFSWRRTAHLTAQVYRQII